MALNILIVDDDSLARQHMRELLGRCGASLCGVVEEAADATRAAGLMRHRRFDLLLLDVRMPGDSGLQLATSLRWWPEKPAVVFVTGYAEHALEAFEADAIDYLTKPVRPERLQRALAKAAVGRPAGADALAEERDSLCVIMRGQARRMPLSQVLYLRSEHKRISVVTADGRFAMDGTLAELAARFPNELIRLHRHTLALRHAITALRRVDSPLSDFPCWQARLRGTSEVLPVSRRLVAAVRASLLVPGR